MMSTRVGVIIGVWFRTDEAADRDGKRLARLANALIDQDWCPHGDGSGERSLEGEPTAKDSNRRAGSMSACAIAGQPRIWPTVGDFRCPLGRDVSNRERLSEARQLRYEVASCCETCLK